MSFGPEYVTVEKPFLDQLAGMGWTVVTGNLDLPSMTGRESFREVLLKPDLRAALARVNRRDGGPWLGRSHIAGGERYRTDWRASPHGSESGGK